MTPRLDKLDWRVLRAVADGWGAAEQVAKVVGVNVSQVRARLAKLRRLRLASHIVTDAGHWRNVITSAGQHALAARSTEPIQHKESNRV